MLKQLPNALTLLRLILAPLIAWAWWMGAAPMSPSDVPETWLREAAVWRSFAAIAFVIAALTDLFDGMLARALDAQSKFGRLIDPIADKALVGLPLIVIATGMWANGYPAWPLVALAAGVIVIRDVSMTWIRLASPDGEGARVSSLAKIKTALELIVIGSLFVVTAMVSSAELSEPAAVGLAPYVGIFETGWLALLVATAALSAWTGWQYLAPRRPA